MSNNFEVLKEEIMARSLNKLHWEFAFDEWHLDGVDYEPGGTCLCTHHPITERCLIENVLTGNKTIVGNCCIRRFMTNIKTNGLFSGLRKITDSLDAWPTLRLLSFAKDKGAISQADFYWAKYLLRKRRKKDGSFIFPMDGGNCPNYRRDRRRAINVAIMNMTHEGEGDKMLAALKERDLRELMTGIWAKDGASHAAEMSSDEGSQA
ncbi:hypothetical protein [Caballeronia sp. LZ035]|uniref:hypothetical protein n=1 Tax=Caballeronia sp. LZ035 TaxID=3038568 RepID=UPI00285A1A19|nr:hypothetical protein [Caballeronia sp. LZ035]MDR5757663.1 hypothetical protein [Caballeronia sp. LZ035]